jgi:DNA-binding transcriptional ArsR family regulator
MNYPKVLQNLQKRHKNTHILMVPVLNVNWQNLPADYSLSERDADVLALIETEDLATFTFDGLKRRTGLHPETLSRILSRLEQEGIIKKGLEGYRVTPKITELKLSSPKKETPTTTLIQTYLPSDLITQRLILNLKGKWFGSLRWFGISENSQGIILKWITEDGAIQIAANIQGTSLNIEAKFLTNNNIDLALKASYQLMSLIGKICISSQTASHAMARSVGYYGGFSLA